MAKFLHLSDATKHQIYTVCDPLASAASKLFFAQKIYSTKTPLSITVIYGFLLAILTLFGQNSSHHYSGVLLVLDLLWVCMFLRSCSKTYIAYRCTSSANYSNQSSKLLRSAVSITDERAVDHTPLIASGLNWQQFDAIYDIYTHTKNGEYLSSHRFYSVYQHSLLREVPNVLFDSHKAKGHQFKYEYLAAQRLSLEGDFDRYFDTYAPDYYQVDTLSFISPETMEVLIQTSNYDIELNGDQLYLYGPLITDSTTLQQVQTLGNKLAQEINDNIDTYHDSYLRIHDKGITAFSRKLLLSPFKSSLFAALFGALTLGIVGFAFYRPHAGITTRDLLINQITILIYILFGEFLYRAIKIRRTNSKVFAQFAKQRRQ
jgi:hypothetical protein